jgi:DNA-binding NtrC family response regulator
MTANIVFVYDEHRTAKRYADGLKAAGYTVAVFSEPAEALKSSDSLCSADLLITRVRFSPDKLNGLALASKAKYRRPGLKVLFVAFPEMRSQIDDLGDFLPMPASTAEVVAAAESLLERF